MGSVLPSALIDLIDCFTNFPGVGEKTAERYAYFALKQDKSLSDNIARALQKLHSSIKICPVTFALIDTSEDVSPLYRDTKRNKSQIAVVAEPFDIIAIENTNSYKGTYHVLGGLISPLDGIGPEHLHIKELCERVSKDNVSEIIIATNASVEGETTALYIQRELENTSVSLTRLARGLPMGIDLEYADHITLTRALEGRTKL